MLRCRCDALGRVTERRLSSVPLQQQNVTQVSTWFFYAEDGVVEESTPTGQTRVRYVSSVDGSIARRSLDTDGNGTLDQILWAFQDADGSTVALAGVDGTLERRFVYDQDGLPEVLDGSGTATQADLGWEQLYHGMRWHDWDRTTNDRTGLYEMGGGRFYSALSGTQIQPDFGRYVGRNAYSPGEVTLHGWQGWVGGVAGTVGTVALGAWAVLTFPVVAPFALVGGVAYLGYQGYAGYHQYGGAGGALAKMSGVSDVYEGYTNTSWGDGSDLGLGTDQRGGMLSGGLVQLAGTAYGGIWLSGRAAAFALNAAGPLDAGLLNVGGRVQFASVRYRGMISLRGQARKTALRDIADYYKNEAFEGIRDPAIPGRYLDSRNRPDYAAGQVEAVWKNAVNVKGRVRDPYTRELLTWNPSRSRQDQWHMGHIKGQEYTKMHARLLNGEMTWAEFLSWYRNPANYQPQSPISNLSHKFESR